MASTWIVVADAFRARLFDWPALNDELTSLKDMVHPAGRMADKSLHSDRAGHSIRDGGGSASFTPSSDAESEEVDRFAREVAAELDAGVSDGRADRLIVFAAAQMLGALRVRMAPATRARVVADEAVVITQADVETIRERARKALPTG